MCIIPLSCLSTVAQCLCDSLPFSLNSFSSSLFRSSFYINFPRAWSCLLFIFWNNAKSCWVNLPKASLLTARLRSVPGNSAPSVHFRAQPEYIGRHSSVNKNSRCDLRFMRFILPKIFTKAVQFPLFMPISFNILFSFVIAASLSIKLKSKTDEKPDHSSAMLHFRKTQTHFTGGFLQTWKLKSLSFRKCSQTIYRRRAFVSSIISRQSIFTSSPQNVRMLFIRA